MSRRHSALLVLGVTAVSFSGVLVRLADVDAFAIAFYRCAFAAGVMLPLALARRGGELRTLSRRQIGLAILAGAFLAAHFMSWIPSLTYTSVAASSVLVTSQPLWVAVLGRLVGERMTRRALAGVIVALAGALIISGGDLAGGGRALIGDALAVAGAITAAAYVLSGRNLRQELSLLAYVAIVYTTAAVLMGVVMMVSRTPFTGYPAKAWLMFVLITLGPQFLGHTVFNYLLGHLEANVVAVAIMAEPVGSTLLALLLLSEVPSLAAVAGGGLILAGVYVALTSQTRRGISEVPVD